MVPRKFILGDSAYPISTYMLTPYQEEDIVNDDNKCLFNLRHSGMNKRRNQKIILINKYLIFLSARLILYLHYQI